MTIGSISSRTTRIIAITTIAVAFAAGVVGGVALERSRNPFPRGAQGPALLLRFNSEIPKELDALNLSADQRRQIEGILRASTQRTTAVVGEILPRLTEITDSTYSEIRVVLSPEQRAKLGATGRATAIRVRRDTSGRTKTDTVPNRP